MHNTLRVERYAGAAELPHGFLLAPNVPLSREYLERIVTQELAAVGRPPFFHIGSDETATLGLGQTQAYVAQRGRSQAYADHIVAMNRLIAPSGARIMLWDDGIESDPGIMKLIPRTAVVVNWHYGDANLVRALHPDDRARRLRADGRAGRQQLERDLSERSHGARQRAALHQ